MTESRFNSTRPAAFAASIRIAALPVACCLFGLAVLGCAGGGEEAEPAGERVENPALGVAIGAVPPVLELAVNEGDQLELVPADDQLAGRLAVLAGESQTSGINLIAAIESHKEDILARPDGEYKGQREIAGMPLGTAFYSRGRYTAEDGTTEEESVVYLVHPWGDRTLQVRYRYPAGDDSPSRLQDHLFELAYALEVLDDAAPSIDGGAGTGGEPASESTTNGGETGG